MTQRSCSPATDLSPCPSVPEPETALRTALAEAHLGRLVRLASAALDVHAVQVRVSTLDGQVERRARAPDEWNRCSEAALAALGEHIARTGESLILDDLRQHDVAGRAPAIGEARIAACAGLPLALADGTRIGSLCAVDVEPHPWTDQELDVLRDLAACVAREIQMGLRVQKEFFERLFESAPEAIVVLDSEDHLLHVNPAFTRIFGYGPEEAVGRTLDSVIVPASERETSRAMTARAASGESVDVEATRLRKDGSPVEVSIRASAIEMGSGRRGVIGVYRDITARKETEARLAARAEELRAMSFTDALTGLSNRRGFTAVAEHEVSRARRSRRPLMLLFADVDNMKEINDEFGHATGDDALVGAAAVLKATFRDSDVLARVGGDEFAVLVWSDGGAPIQTLLERLQGHLDLHNGLGARPYELSMSVGKAECDLTSPAPLEDMLRRADAAMYEVKRSRQHGAAGPVFVYG